MRKDAQFYYTLFFVTANPNMPDEELLLLSMNDMNIAKLTSVDLPLFKGIMSDLFPGVETPLIDYSKVIGRNGLSGTTYYFIIVICEVINNSFINSNIKLINKQLNHLTLSSD